MTEGSLHVRDRYPTGSSIPAHYLVLPEHQPEFADLEGCPIGGFDDLGHAICAANRSADRGAQPAIIHAESGRQYRFAELDQLSMQVARGLRARGIGLGDRIAFRTPNVPEIAIVALGCWKAGAVVVPTPVQVRAGELRFYLEDVGARALFVYARTAVYDEVPDAIKGTSVENVFAFGDEDEIPGAVAWSELLARDGGDLPATPVDSVAIIWHTGGTTGRPKAIYHTHRRALLGSHALSRATGIRPGERWSAGAPVGHALGFASHTFWPLLHGATVVIVEDFPSPRALLDAIATHRVNGFAAISLTWARMLDELRKSPVDVSSLTSTYAMWQSAASTQIYDGWLELGLELRNNFGCTAFASWVLCPTPSEPVPRASLGRPVPGYEVVALDLEATDGIVPVPTGTQGRLAARGVSGLTYWNRPELQQRDVREGWVLIDDVVSFDDDDNATYYGRTDYVISTAGHKVTPVEVEQVLALHDAVREVGVIGAPDPERQEIVAAFVAVAEGYEAGPELVRELQEFAKARIAPYKYPRRIEFVDALPRDHVGKLQPGVLRKWARGESEIPA
jgi:2-aminobenzoate-CoA ligase